MPKENDEMITAMRAVMKAGMKMAGKSGFVCGMGFVASPGEDTQAAQRMVRQMLGAQEPLAGNIESQGRIIEGSRAIVSSTTTIQNDTDMSKAIFDNQANVRGGSR